MLEINWLYSASQYRLAVLLRSHDIPFIVLNYPTPRSFLHHQGLINWCSIV